MKKRCKKWVYIEPDPITFFAGLFLWALTVFTLLDLKEAIFTGLALVIYGYSISYGSKNYKDYCKEEMKK